MKALIFNSGLGNRMGDFTRTQHKSMARLANGETIFRRQLRILAEHGITEFVVTTGPFADQLMAEAASVRGDLQVTWVPNEVYDQTNYIYSLHLAGEYLDDDVLMLHGDLVFNRAALSRLLADPRPDLGLVNTELAQPAKDFKARVVDGRICEVSVSIYDPDCHAFQPIYKLSRRAMMTWLDRVGEFVASGKTDVYAENAFNEVSDSVDVHAFSYAGESVNEVDTLDDLTEVAAQIRLFDFAEQPVLAAPDDYRRIPELLRAAGAVRPLVVGGKSYDGSFVKTFLAGEGIPTVGFGGYSSNPKLAEVQAGLRLFRDEGCDSIISVGGGSAIDVAKCIKLLAAGGSEEFPAFGAPLAMGHPHLAVPTTAGTGSESTHFAVVYVGGEKKSIAHDAMLPDWVLLEPRLLEGLPDYHKKASLLDALSQCIESSWSRGATDLSRDYATRGIQLILDNLFAYFHKAGFDLVAARQILIASNLGGHAINLTKTTAPHAMSYKMTSLHGTAHGHAVALCLSGVLRQFIHRAETDPATEAVVGEALDRLAVALQSTSRVEAADKFDLVLELLQVAAPESPGSPSLEELVASVNQERLDNSPIPLTAEQIRQVYEYVFHLRAVPFEADPDQPVLATRLTASDYARRQALHGYEVQVLAELDEFCSEHSLQYYLSEGSMLGAVRHGGMIPWDDDIDVMMPRADFDRLLARAAAGQLPDRVHLDSFRSNPKHWVFGAKLQLVQPTEFHLPKVASLATYNGPYIDIFPVDPVARTSGPVFRFQALLLRTLRRMLFMSSGRSRGLRRNPIVRIPLYLLTRVVSTRTVHTWVVAAQTRLNSSPDATHWANLCSYYPIEREVFPAEWFGVGRRVPFERLQIPVPTEAAQMLTTIYGPDFRRLPSRQVVGHRSHAFDRVADDPTPRP